jgi:hypothetical protein
MIEYFHFRIADPSSTTGFADIVVRDTNVHLARAHAFSLLVEKGYLDVRLYELELIRQSPELGIPNIVFHTLENKNRRR